MKRQTQRAKRHALYGWVKWFPVLALIFSILFFDAWLNIQKRKTDYVLGRLNNDLRDLIAETDKVEAQAAVNRNLDDLALVQEELGMQLPEPGQIETIEYVPGTWVPLRPTIEFTLAQAPEAALPVEEFVQAAPAEMVEELPLQPMEMMATEETVLIAPEPDTTPVILQPEALEPAEAVEESAPEPTITWSAEALEPLPDPIESDMPVELSALEPEPELIEFNTPSIQESLDASIEELLD